MRTARLVFGLQVLGFLLGGMILMGSVVTLPASPPERPDAAPTVREDSNRPPGESTSAAPGFDASRAAPDLQPEQNPSPADSPVQQPQSDERPSSGFSSFLVGTLLAIVAGFIAIAPIVTLAVSLVMDDGWLRYLVFVAGWAFSFFSGGIVIGFLGVFAAEALGLGSGLLESALPVGVIAGLLAYPIAAWWGRRWFQSLPRERYVAWKRALTGGALLGFGVGSIAHLLRSAIPASGGGGGGAGGFGGFGGGSFGGGGAGGSWSASAGGASPSGTAASAGATATGASTTGSSAGVASGATAPAVVSGTAPAANSSTNGWTALLPTWLQQFQWIHGVLFVLALLSFAVIGAWSAEYLWQDTGLLMLVFGTGGAYGIYTLWRWWGPADSSLPEREFHGGEASSSWS